jgi:hypothetical protein
MKKEYSMRCPLRNVVVTALALASLAPSVPGCGGRADNGTFEVEELHDDFRQLRNAMESLHPALYEFTDRAEFDQLLDLQYASIDRPMTVEEFYRAIKPVVARIGCGHARLYTPEGYWDRAPHRFFPLKLVVLEAGTYALGNYNQAVIVAPGSEILSINDVPMSELVFVMMSDISADAYNESWKRHRFNDVFPYLYALLYGFPEEFVITYLAPGQSEAQEATLEPVSRETLSSASEGEHEAGGEWVDPNLGFEIIEDPRAAILTIRSFAYYDEREKFDAFIDDSFQRIRELGVENLIVDLRDNDGGDPFCTTHLLSHIETRPVRYFAKSYWQYEEFARPIPLGRNRFEGNLWILINGGCFSSTGHLCALLDYHNFGRLVGSETGGTFTCNDATKEIVLKHTRIRVNMPRMTFTAAVYDMPKSRGILPDYPVEPRIEDLVEGRDTVKEFALGLIRKSGGH